MKRSGVIGCALCLFAVDCNNVPGSYSFDTDEAPVSTPTPTRTDLGLGVWESPFRLDLPDIQGCEALDLLLVVDNSGSTEEIRANFENVIPGFVDSFRSAGIGRDLHIGITTTDEYEGNPEECGSFGALVNMDKCPAFTTGASYMNVVDLDTGGFACSMDLATGSGSEQPMRAFLEAIKPPHVEGDPPYGVRFDDCNEGFRRPDAFLLVAVITDARDFNSPGTPETWRVESEYLAPSGLFVVYFGPDETCPDQEATEDPGVEAFLAHVDHVRAPVCGDLVSTLDAALERLVVDCGAVVPEG